MTFVLSYIFVLTEKKIIIADEMYSPEYIINLYFLHRSCYFTVVQIVQFHPLRRVNNFLGRRLSRDTTPVTRNSYL